MIALLTLLFGFTGSFLPELLKIINRRQDNAHELEMFKVRAQQVAAEHTYRMEEIAAQADIAESQELHKPQPSYGVQMLDAAHDYGWSRAAILPGVYLFILLDFFTAMVRPTITYTVVAGYLAYKYGRFMLMQSVSDASFNWYEGVVNLWGEQDYAILTLCLGFWFGGRLAKYAFGEKGKT